MARTSLTDYLALTPEMATAQWRLLDARSEPLPGVRQPTFLPIETLLSYAASHVVEHRRFGSTTAKSAPTPVPELARLFKRPNSSVLAKMANLDGSRPNGGRHDSAVADALSGDEDLLRKLYTTIFDAARRAGVDSARLPDFLGIYRATVATGETDAVVEGAEPTSPVEEAFRRSMFGSSEMVTRALRSRRGQPAFRQRLMETYDGTCGVTSSRVQPLLEAAHILPHARGGTYEIRNGLLLRADVHTLFDFGYLAIDPTTWTTVVHESLSGTEYSPQFHGRPFRLPAARSHWPDAELLLERARAAGFVG